MAATVTGICFVTLLGAFALKGQCLAPWQDRHQYESLCYNDIQPLWSERGIDRGRFPYVDGSLRDGRLVAGAVEYPVLTGVFMWATGLGTSSSNEYLVRSAVLLAPFALVTAYLLGRLAGWRALLWAAAPALVLYAFHNWDLPAVAAAVLGFYLWHKDRGLLAAAAFGAGGALKVFPLLFIVPLVVERLWARDRRSAAAIAGAGAGTFGLINLPFALAGPEGWWATYEFHRVRGPNYDSIWAVRSPLDLPWLEPPVLNLVSGGLTLGLIAGVVAAAWVAAGRSGDFPTVQLAGALLAVFMLAAKVHSPQYALWILPFFVLLAVPIAWWVAYAAVDILVYVGVFRFFFDVCSATGCDPGTVPGFFEQMMGAGVWLRALLLVVLAALFLRARAPCRVASHPPLNVVTVGN